MDNHPCPDRVRRAVRLTAHGLLIPLFVITMVSAEKDTVVGWHMVAGAALMFVVFVWSISQHLMEWEKGKRLPCTVVLCVAATAISGALSWLAHVTDAPHDTSIGWVRDNHDVFAAITLTILVAHIIAMGIRRFLEHRNRRYGEYPQ